MPPTPDTTERAAALASAVRGLAVEISRVEVEIEPIEVPSYPGGPRPSSTAVVSGAGLTGRGEHVGWTEAAHEDFRRAAPSAVANGASTVGDISSRLRETLPDPYDRAAIEACVLDLALRQANRSLGSLVGATGSATRYVVSFAASGDPTPELRQTIGETDGPEAKLDVDLLWTDATYRALAETGRIAVLDWKRTGTPAQHARAHRFLPDTLLEDPGPAPCDGAPPIAARRSLDGPFSDAAALHALPPPAAANVKPARMGGVLEALDGVDFCVRNGIGVYFGGMFELGAGRRQLLALASLLAPDGPNDIAPIPRTTPAPPWPRRLAPPRGPGFGDFSNATGRSDQSTHQT